MSDSKQPRIAFIGLGEMGGPMAASLLAAGYSVIGYDLQTACMDALSAKGGEAAPTIAEAVARAEIVCTMLPSSERFVEVAREQLVPRARPGQVFVEMGTTVPGEVRRLAAAFAERGASLIDAPVSGGRAGAEKRALRMFVGGDEAIVARVRPMLVAIGGDQGLFYCGGTGQGSVMKGVNQLKMGLEAAIHVEILAFAQREGLDPLLIEQVYGPHGRLSFGEYPRRVSEGGGDFIGVKFRELPYYLAQAREGGYQLPLTAALFDFCQTGERVVVDDHRPAPSFWHELMTETPGRKTI